MKQESPHILKQYLPLPFPGSRNSAQAGFTWIELVVVIIIVGILLSIVYAEYVDMTESARTAKCVSNQMSLEAAQRLHYSTTAMTGNAEYATDFNGLVPFLRDGAVPACPSNGNYVLKANGDVSCTDPAHQR